MTNEYRMSFADSSAWMNGTCNESTAAGASFSSVMASGNSIRLKITDPVETYGGTATIEFSSGYQLWVVAFDSDLKYLGKTNGSVTTWENSPYTADFNDAAYLGVVIRKSNDGAIDPSEAPTVDLTVTITGGVLPMIKATSEVTITDNTDIDSLVTWYYLTTSATKPEAPTTTQTSDSVPSPWTQNEPTFTAGTVTNYLYCCIQTRWKDGSCTWGTVQLSSAYEQSKQAWNKANAAQSSIDNLEVGGRNLLVGSEFFDPSATLFNGSNVYPYGSTKYDGQQVYYMSGPRYVLVNLGSLADGQEYTFSYDLQRASGQSIFITIGSVSEIVGTSVTGTWVRTSLTFTASAETTSAKLRVYTDDESGRNDWIAAVRHFKLERGNVATDWTPAPEDLEAAIEEAAAVAGNYIIETATNDVWVHSEDHGPQSDGTVTANTYGWRIGSVFELVRAGVSYMKMWVDNSVAKLRLGLESAGHAIFSLGGMEVYGDSTTKVAALTPDGVVVGRSDGARFVADESSVALYSKDTEKVFDVEVGSSASSTTYIGHINVASGQSVSSVSVISEYATPSFTYVKVNGTSVSYSTQAMSSSETLPDGTTTVTTRRAVANLSSAVSGPASIEYAYTVNEPPVTAVVGRRGGNHVEVTSDGVEVFTNRDTSVAEFGDTARVGLESSGHVELDSTGMEVFTDASTSVAKFGDDVRLGTTSGYNIKLDGDAGDITLNNGSTNILSLQRWNNNDASGELRIGKTSFHGTEFSGGTGVSCVANAGNSSVSDSVADNVTVNLTAQTATKYSSFEISAYGIATLNCHLFNIMGDLSVEDISINASQIANTVLAAPNGSAGSPEFRQLVAADLPTVPISSGGTGQTSANAAARALGLAKTKGDSFTLNYVNAVGFLTNSRKQAVVTVYFPYLIYGITSGNSCTLTGTFTARQNNGYCFGSTSTTPANLTSVTVSITRIQSGALTFSITGGEQTAAINNDPIALYFTSLTVTLT